MKSICSTLDMYVCDKEVRDKDNRWDYGKEFYFFYMKLV